MPHVGRAISAGLRDFVIVDNIKSEVKAEPIGISIEIVDSLPSGIATIELVALRWINPHRSVTDAASMISRYIELGVLEVTRDRQPTSATIIKIYNLQSIPVTSDSC